MLALFPFSNGLEMSLPLSHVKNLVIGNGQMCSKQRLLAKHVWEFLQVIPGNFWVGPGDEAMQTMLGGIWTHYTLLFIQ